MAKINPQKIEGNWKKGIALDVHTVSSTYTGVNEFGHDTFENQYSELGDLLHRLKYKHDLSVVEEIVASVVEFLKQYPKAVDIIVPVPPSAKRANQPVITVAKGISIALGLPLAECVTPTRETTALKGVTDPAKRKELVSGLYAVDSSKTTGRNILLFDDLYRSGTTLNEITDILLKDGKAASVRVLTLTRTRSNR
jgi:competence protein ComFC